MTALAGIEVRRRRKLGRVLIGVAIGAMLKLDLEQRVFSLGNVTLLALQAGVAALQGIGAGGVFLRGESRRLPSVHGMAPGTLAAAGAPGELPVVGIGLVAIHALLEGQRLLEISASVALRAIDGGVFSLQRIFRFGVIETLVNRRKGNLFPAGGIVAGLAALGEAAVMGIAVAVGALVEGKAGVARFAILPRRVALGARDLGMQSGQGITGLRMVELTDTDALPVFRIVALLAGRA